MLPRALVLIGLATVLAACGSENEADPVDAIPAASRDAVREAQQVDASSFPQADGRSLEELAAEFDTEGVQAIVAASVFRPSQRQRLPFALLDDGAEFVYGDTVVYLQRRGTSKVLGPFPAPADVLVTEPRYRSRQAASEDDPFAAIYEAMVPIGRPGTWDALAVSDAGERRVAAQMAFQVVSAAKDRVPDIGEPAPEVRTDTLGSVKGDEELLSTRIPPALELAEKSLHEVIGRKPVALLFATPQLCQSRVCGPVVDEMLQMKSKYGDDVAFIHQEVYADNDPNKGLREALRRFNLPSEPWLFTIDEDGRIAARLEGSFGLRAFERAIEAARH